MLDLAAIDASLGARIQSQLEDVTIIFERQLASDLSAVNTLCNHIERYRGKMLRPTVVLVTGLAAAGEPCDGTALTEAHRVVAAVVEMIHMATLVHDDVLDDADIRRQAETVNHLHGNEMAVMLGDYLISNSFALCSSIHRPEINIALGNVTNTLCEGELVQLQHRNNFGIDERTYFEIVERKTASLIGEACRLGAMLSDADDTVQHAMHRFGIKLGTAFQIQDDLLDIVGEAEIVGKSLGRDLEKGKLTLPIIRLLDQATQSDRGEALRLIQSRNPEALRQMLLDSGTLDSTRATAARLIDEAKRELMTLPSSSAADLMATLADAVIDRRF